jgi:hypothetical protein
MPNSFITNLYPVPVTGASAQRLEPTSLVEATFSTFDANTKFITFDVQANDVFMTIDGSPPATNNGHKLYAGRSYSIARQTADFARFIGDGSAVIYASQLTS